MTATDSIAAILQGEPDWKALPDGTPPTVQLLLRRCLHKDRRRRLRDIGDARIELEQAIDDPASTSLGLAGAALAAATHRRRTWRDLLPWAAAAIALLAAPVTWWRMRPAPPVPPQVVRLSVRVPEDRPLMPSPHLSISRDGSRIALRCRPGAGMDESIYVRRLDQALPVLLEGTLDAAYPFFSPDGEWVAFYQGGRLRKVSTRGGPPITLCSASGFRRRQPLPRAVGLHRRARAADDEHGLPGAHGLVAGRANRAVRADRRRDGRRRLAAPARRVGGR